MFKTYEEALNWIHGRKIFGMKPGLKRMEWMLKKLESPQEKIKAIHVAGTNGKGSTVTFLRSILEANGKIVGTFTSPYIETFNERISVNGEPISDEEITRLANIVYPLALELEETELDGPTEFEVITTMMFIYFGEGHADIVVIEVGLGGLLDSTNVIIPVVSAITTIGLDHMQVLGESLAEIAFQKAGIIKPFVPIVVGKVPEEALQVIQQVAKKNNSTIKLFGEDYWSSKCQTLPTWGEQFTFEDEYIYLNQVQIKMLGQHQIENAMVALETIQIYCQETGLELNHEAIRRGLKTAFWPGRMEKISSSPIIILDGAHNEPAIGRLIETINADFKQQEIHLIFAVLQDKAVNKMISLLEELPNCHITLTSFDNPRAAKIEELESYRLSGITIKEYWQEALADIIQEMDENDIILITGSLYFISEVRTLLIK
ncbi:dihydrofolate synthase / folylpolyglutamate synthase [Carnobacterium iners]|uniref:Dihydrofolate synthase/folylpolyglutamate synthase n=1 Tax=Carnobacterium iners TaxID=1073423 RepID=A0A1X7NPM7_9LACT|nr:folylpolyglutamate synthase/dihydrofolate synthase family protein [Carnobacterium iners]SEK31796.1 dihydrofolate synthase / folylpolyglutamate synthase [Carnobacterium iners]SMH39216.1 dihydrofolate synthase / folylpolyglutamate synthase [Carnobacterium iners]